MSEDASNGYEAVARSYIAGRGTRPSTGDAIGTSIVRDWARALPSGAAVLDLGCGSGEPSMRILLGAGHAAYAVDASVTMVAAFRERFPGVPIEHDSVESSPFFNRTFGGVLAWGLVFLVEPDAQALVIQKVAAALNRGGRFLFTAPRDQVQWLDVMTGRLSQSLGASVYVQLLSDAGLTVLAETDDEGDNHYYFVAKA